MKRISIWSVLLGILAILWTVFIWSNSAKSAVESSGQSLQVLDLLEPILLSLGLEWDTLHHLVRKAAHMIEFALLGALWSGGLRRYRFFPPFTLCFLTALIDETIQLGYPGRSGQITDLWVDLSGVVLGFVVSTLLVQLSRRTTVKSKHR